MFKVNNEDTRAMPILYLFIAYSLYVERFEH